jgi:hypothetical protein
MSRAALISRYRLVLGLFITGLALSGITAFPLLHELRLLAAWLGIAPDADYHTLTGLQHWIGFVRTGLEETWARYPFIGYGTDWLAFGHLIIATFFIGPWREPGGYEWTLKAGMIACVAVIPLAMTCGAVRGIPFYWRLIDCSFGFFGIVPLVYCLSQGRHISNMTSQTSRP